MDAGQPPPITGHVVLLPAATPPRTLRLVTDLDLLLAHTIASVRLNQRTIVFEPPASSVACARCQEAHAEARKVIEAAGGLARCQVSRREGRPSAGFAEVRNIRAVAGPRVLPLPRHFVATR